MLASCSELTLIPTSSLAVIQLRGLMAQYQFHMSPEKSMFSSLIKLIYGIVSCISFIIVRDFPLIFNFENCVIRYNRYIWYPRKSATNCNEIWCRSLTSVLIAGSVTMNQSSFLRNSTTNSQTWLCLLILASWTNLHNMAQKLNSPAGITQNARPWTVSTMSQFRMVDACPYLNYTDVIVYAHLSRARHCIAHRCAVGTRLECDRPHSISWHIQSTANHSLNIVWCWTNFTIDNISC